MGSEKASPKKKGGAVMKRMRGSLLIGGICLLVAAWAWLAHAYEGGPVATGGTLVGEVKLTGDIPEPKKIMIDKDQEVCGKERLSEALIVSKTSKGIQHAVVSLVGIKKGRPVDRPKGGIEFVQKGCRFTSHVLVVPEQGTVDIINDDPMTHNIHTFSIENAPINKAQPKTLRRISATLEVPETFRVQCDIHKFMQGWWIVTDSPYYVLTDAEGRFTLKDVPPGTYKLQVWHETLGVQTKEVTVKPKEETRVTVEVKATKKS